MLIWEADILELLVLVFELIERAEKDIIIAQLENLSK
jgi:hypothetical protein